MLNKYINRHKKVKKMMALVVALVFFQVFVVKDICSAIEGASVYGIKTYTVSGPEVLNVESFSIPAHLGEIRDSFKGPSNRIVVHLQDAHCNYYAQRKISEIIDYLTREFGLNILNLEDLRNKKFSSLSQGQKKRVSVGKIFLRERELYLLDEPTSNVDPKISKGIRQLLAALSKDKFVLYSSHNLYEAREMGTYLIVIKNGALTYFDRIENVKTKQYRVGFKTLNDISKMLPKSKLENGYFVVTVQNPEEVAKIVNKIVAKGARIIELRELDNPLQEFFEEG